MRPSKLEPWLACGLAALLAVVAALLLWQSREFTAFASIFPRAVGSALLLLSVLVIWRTLRRAGRTSAGLVGDGLWRSAVLVLTLLAWVSVLETAGFAPASWAGFLVLALLSNRDPLTPGRVLGFVAAAFASVALLLLLFQKGLGVRLPAGTWFPGVFG